MRFNIIMLMLFSILVSILLIGSVSADLGTFKQNECVRIKTILNATAVNISTISYPNSTIVISNKAMTKVGQTFYYDFCNTSILGTYIYDYFDNSGNVYVNSFEITGNGNEKPSGVVIVLFALLIIIIFSMITYVILYSIGHAVSLDFDIRDAAYNLGLFFAVVIIYLLGETYFGNPTISSLLEWAIYIGIFTNVFLPIIYFILTLTVGSWMEQRVKGVDM